MCKHVYQSIIHDNKYLSGWLWDVHAVGNNAAIKNHVYGIPTMI